MKRWQIVALAVAVLAVAGYFYLRSRGIASGLGGGSTLTASDAASSDAGSFTTRITQMNWQTVNRPDAGFKVDMPADPKDLQVPAYNEAGSTEQVRMMFASPDGDTTFAVSWEDNPPVARVNDRSPDKTLDAARDGMLSRTQTVLDTEARVMAVGYPARDIASRNAGGGVLNARLIYTGERLYTLLALYPSISVRREQDVVRFYNSFATSRSPGETLPSASPRGE